MSILNSDKITINILAINGFTGNVTDFDLINNRILASRPLKDSFNINWFYSKYINYDYSDVNKSVQDTFLELFKKEISSLPINFNSNNVINVLIGYSMGGRLALFHCLKSKPNWDALVLISSNPGIESNELREKRLLSDKELIKMIEEKGTYSFINYWKNTEIIKTQQNAPHGFFNRMIEKKYKLNPVKLIRSLEYFGQGVFPNLWNNIKSLNIPVLCISGDKDDKYTKINFKIKQIIKKSTIQIIENSGHAPHIENPVDTSIKISDFLKHIAKKNRNKLPSSY